MGGCLLVNLKGALYEQAIKVFTALITWGIGILLMMAYCILVYALQKIFNVYVMIVGALIFLTFAYVAIDLWWSYKKT